MKRADGHRCDTCRNRSNRCDACRAERAAVVRAKRERYKLAGKCQDCGKKAAASLTRCRTCANANSLISGESHKRARLT